MTDRCPVSHRGPPSFFCSNKRWEDNAKKGKGGGEGGSEKKDKRGSQEDKTMNEERIKSADG
jgi:hypothetical protein